MIITRNWNWRHAIKCALFSVSLDTRAGKLAQGTAGPVRPRAGIRRDAHRQVLADEDGVRYAAMLAARGNTPGLAARAAIAAARAELDAIRYRRSA
jgi:hypothetical protein